MKMRAKSKLDREKKERGEDCWRNFFFVQFEEEEEDWIVASKKRDLNIYGDGGISWLIFGELIGEIINGA